jgi:hypothetical protein
MAEPHTPSPEPLGSLQHQPDQGEYTRELIDFSQLALPQMHHKQDINFLTQENFEESKNNGDLTNANILQLRTFKLPYSLLMLPSNILLRLTTRKARL